MKKNKYSRQDYLFWVVALTVISGFCSNYVGTSIMSPFSATLSATVSALCALGAYGATRHIKRNIRQLVIACITPWVVLSGFMSLVNGWVPLVVALTATVAAAAAVMAFVFTKKKENREIKELHKWYLAKGFLIFRDALLICLALLSLFTQPDALETSLRNYCL